MSNNFENKRSLNKSPPLISGNDAKRLKTDHIENTSSSKKVDPDQIMRLHADGLETPFP